MMKAERITRVVGGLQYVFHSTVTTVSRNIRDYDWRTVESSHYVTVWRQTTIVIGDLRRNVMAWADCGSIRPFWCYL